MSDENLLKEYNKLKAEYAELKIASGKADKEYLNLCRSYNIRGKVINILTERILEMEKERAKEENVCS